MFDIVITIVFQYVFRLKIYQNNLFIIFLNFVLTSLYQNDLKTKKNWNKEKNNLKNIFKIQKQTDF
jgi:hypothetical protein